MTYPWPQTISLSIILFSPSHIPWSSLQSLLYWLQCCFQLSFLTRPFSAPLHTALIHNRPLLIFFLSINALTYPSTGFAQRLFQTPRSPLSVSTTIFWNLWQGKEKSFLPTLSKHLTFWLPFFRNDKTTKIQDVFTHQYDFLISSTTLSSESVWASPNSQAVQDSSNLAVALLNLRVYSQAASWAPSTVNFRMKHALVVFLSLRNLQKQKVCVCLKIIPNI